MLSEVAVIACAEAIKAVAMATTAIVEGQPKELREKAWYRWERMIDTVEKAFGIPPPKEQTKH